MFISRKRAGGHGGVRMSATWRSKLIRSAHFAAEPVNTSALKRAADCRRATRPPPSITRPISLPCALRDVTPRPTSSKPRSPPSPAADIRRIHRCSRTTASETRSQAQHARRHACPSLSPPPPRMRNIRARSPRATRAQFTPRHPPLTAAASGPGASPGHSRTSPTSYRAVQPTTAAKERDHYKAESAQVWSAREHRRLRAASRS